MERDFTKRSEPADGQQPSYGPWADIRARSLVEFVNEVSKLLGAPRDARLREQLYAVVFSNGTKTVSYAGFTYTGKMLLDVFYKRRVQSEELFQKRADWDRFQEAVRNLNDPDTPVHCRHLLLKIAATIEEQQRANAQEKGWI